MPYQKILIVDDSSTSRMITKRCFEIAGYTGVEYLEAEDGIEALTRLQENTIDLILTDLNMPKLDGFNFIKKIKNDDKSKDLRIVVVSGLAGSISEDDLKKMGVFAYIKKPISPQKIIEALQNQS